MSLGSSPASAIAARQASSVSSSGSRPRRRATSDWPTPLMADRFSMYVSLAAIAGSPRLEQRDPHVAVAILAVLEHDLDRHADAHVLGLAADDVGLQPQLGLLLDRHQRDRVRQRHARDPGLVVDGEGDDGGSAAHALGLRKLAV